MGVIIFIVLLDFEVLTDSSLPHKLVYILIHFEYTTNLFFFNFFFSLLFIVHIRYKFAPNRSQSMSEIRFD